MAKEPAATAPPARRDRVHYLYLAVVGAVVLGCAALASLFCALGVHIAVSRVLFAMGRERVLPRWLGVLHPRWGTPWR